MADGFVGALRRAWELAAGEQTIVGQAQELKAQVDAAQARLKIVRREYARLMAEQFGAEAALYDHIYRIRPREDEGFDDVTYTLACGSRLSEREWAEAADKGDEISTEQWAQLEERAQVHLVYQTRNDQWVEPLLQHALTVDGERVDRLRRAVEHARTQRAQLEGAKVESQVTLTMAQARLQELTQRASSTVTEHATTTVDLAKSERR
jgi:hypothetical protein